MSDRLLLRLCVDGSLVWLPHDAAGRALAAASSGAPPAPVLARAQQVSVLVPAEDVLLLEAPAVSRRRAELAKAVPFALEDRLACPVEELHFALAAQPADGSIAVAAVARARLHDWLGTLAAHGISPDVLIPETLALPAARATLILDGDRALLRTGAAQGSACHIGDLDAWLAASPPAALEVFDFRNAPRLDLPTAVEHYHERQREPLAVFAAQLRAPATLNLLQGEFAPRHRELPAQRLWRIAAMLAGATLLLGLLYSAGDWLRLSHESARLDGAMRDVLHATFPKFDHVAGNPHQLMQSELARLHGEGDAGSLLHVLAQIAPVLGSSTRVVVKGIEYHNAALELSLRAPDLQTLDLVRERLANLDGIKAELTSAGSATSQDAGIEGRLRITAGKS